MIVKLTNIIPQYIFFRKKVYYVDKSKVNKLKGALIVSNHTSVYDFPLIMNIFYFRTVRTLIAKEVFEKNKLLNLFLKLIGGIKVDRQNYDFSFTGKMIKWLERKKLGLIFPESRLPLKHEINDLIEFKPSYIYIALEAGVPIIPIYTNGVYGVSRRKKEKNRAKVIIGEPIDINALICEDKTEKENIEFINNYVRNKIKVLKDNLANK